VSEANEVEGQENRKADLVSFQGYDHVDCRVRSLSEAIAFYDALMPELGLPEKRYSYVDQNEAWTETTADRPHNVVEYFEPAQPGKAACFLGVIERADHKPTFTRIAFKVSRSRLSEFESILKRIGAANVELSEDMEAYPAIFFEDPSGNKLEVVARKARE
jgi:catechol 2,3-dioxygenase-like lactoylglutathione lyase family enzyme